MVTENKTESSSKITGNVIDEKGRSVAGVIITLDKKETRTLFDGTFKFEDLNPGSYTLKISPEGYQEQNRLIDVKEGEEICFDIKIEPKHGVGRIFGYIIDEKSGRPPLKSGSVYMFRPTLNQNSGMDPSTGYFEFSNLPEGVYTIWTSVLDYHEEKKSILLEENEERRVDITIKMKVEEEEVPWG